MVDFSHLRKLDVNEASEAEYVFEDIVQGKDDDGGDICPSVWLKPMTDANEAFLNERVRLAVERAEAAQKETKANRRKRILSAEQIEDDREQDRILLARTCAVRWGVAPKDVNGAEPEFNEQNCYDFFAALPNYMFDPCRGFASNVYNFVDRDALKDGGEALGNS